MGQTLDKQSTIEFEKFATQILEDEISLSNPSIKSMRTTPLEKYGEYLAFWYACINLCQNPLDGPFRVKTFVSSDLEVASRQEFTVTLTEIVPRTPKDLEEPSENPLGLGQVVSFFGLDSVLRNSSLNYFVRSDNLPFGPPPMTTAVIKYNVNKANGEIAAVISSDTLGEGNVEKFWMTLHKDPLVWECWGELPDRRMPDDKRLCSLVKQRLSNILGKRTWVNPTKPVKDACEVQVVTDAISPGNPTLKSVLTEPLDAYVDAVPLWNEWLEEIKTEAVEITWVSAHAFMTSSTPVVFSWDADDWNSTIVQFNDKTQEITEAFCDESETLQRTVRTKLWNDPLRIECWTELPGGRVSSAKDSEVVYQRFQYFVRSMLKKLNDRENSPPKWSKEMTRAIAAQVQQASSS